MLALRLIVVAFMVSLAAGCASNGKPKCNLLGENQECGAPPPPPPPAPVAPAPAPAPDTCGRIVLRGVNFAFDSAALDGSSSVVLDAAAEDRRRFLEAMDDDFNTGGAIGALFDLVRGLNKFVDDEKLEEPGRQSPEQLAVLKQGATMLAELAATLGLFRKSPEQESSGDGELTGKLMELLIEVRADARKAKNFAMADKIRDSLSKIGVTLEDRPGGTEWSAGK